MATLKFLGDSSLGFDSASSFKFVDVLTTSTPNIESTGITCDAFGCTGSWRVRNTDSSSAVVYSDTDSTPTTSRGTISPNGLTGLLSAELGPLGGFVYARAQASGKAMSSINSVLIPNDGGGF